DPVSHYVLRGPDDAFSDGVCNPPGHLDLSEITDALAPAVIPLRELIVFGRAVQNPGSAAVVDVRRNGLVGLVGIGGISGPTIATVAFFARFGLQRIVPGALQAVYSAPDQASVPTEARKG